VILLRRVFLLLAPALFLLVPSLASAQSGLAQGQALLDRADFDAAVRAFSAAESATSGLSRRELASLYAGRASAHLALGRESAMEADLRRLASLDRDYVFGPASRPEIGQTFDRVKASIDGSPSISVSVSEDVGAVRIEAEVENDSQDLTRTLSIRARVAGGAWASSDGDGLSLPVTDGSSVEYFVEAIGPGGAMIANEGSEDSPTTHTVVGAAADGPPPDDPLEDDDDGGGGNVGLWVGLAVGAAVVAIVVAIIVVAASSADNQTSMPSPPMIYP